MCRLCCEVRVDRDRRRALPWSVPPARISSDRDPAGGLPALRGPHGRSRAGVRAHRPGRWPDARADAVPGPPLEREALSVRAVADRLRGPGSARAYRTREVLCVGRGRRDPCGAIGLESGDAFVFGGPARLRYHGVSRILPGTAPAVL